MPYSDDERLHKAEQISGNMAAMRFYIAVAAGIGLVSAFFYRGAPEKLTPPACTLTVHVALDPNQTTETLTVEVRKSGGFKWLHDRLVTSETVELNETRSSAKLELKLPGSGPIVYVIKGSSKLSVRGGTAAAECDTPEQPLTVQGNATYHVTRKPDEGKGAQDKLAYTASLSRTAPTGASAFQDVKVPLVIDVVAELGAIMTAERIDVTFMRPDKSIAKSITLNMTSAQRRVETQVSLMEGRYEFSMSGSGEVLTNKQGATRVFQMQAQGRVDVTSGKKLRYERITNPSSEVYSAKLVAE
jgi:hypothetical protein